MRIIVCLKLISDPDVLEFDITSEALRNVHPVLDPVDRCVLEEGLALRQQRGGEVIALSVAPAVGDGVLKKALRYGADRAIRLWHEDLKDADTWLVSRVIRDEVDRLGFDLVLCGASSGDMGSGLMVSALAHRLNIASATGVIALEIENDNNLLAEKKLPGGERETYALEMPAVLGVLEGLNEPRYVALYSRIYQEGGRKTVEFVKARRGDSSEKPLIKNLRFSQVSPRIKSGINLASLSAQDQLKMMRGELGRENKELFEGSPGDAAKKIIEHLKEYLK